MNQRSIQCAFKGERANVHPDTLEAVLRQNVVRLARDRPESAGHGRESGLTQATNILKSRTVHGRTGLADG
jgi:hypothetical protein